jgi:hypothetical protein
LRWPLTLAAYPPQSDDEFWRRLMACARTEDLRGLMYQKTIGCQLPPDVEAELMEDYRAAAESNVVQLHEFMEVADLLRERALEMMVLPGASLLGLYPDLGCRAMDDIDILVRPEDHEAVSAALVDAGLSRQGRYPDLFSNENLTIDLHQDLSNSSRIRSRQFAGWMDPSEVWRDAVDSQVDEARVRRMCAEDETLFTAVHALRHGFSRCTWFVDLLLLLRTDLDWKRVAAKASRYRLQRPLAYALRFLDLCEMSPLPPQLRVSLDGQEIGHLESRILRRAFADRHRRNWGDLLWSFNVSGIHRKCRFLGETFFPAPDVLLQVFPFLPRPLYPAAYPLRILQVLQRGADHGLSFLSGSGRSND